MKSWIVILMAALGITSHAFAFTLPTDGFTNMGRQISVKDPGFWERAGNIYDAQKYERDQKKMYESASDSGSDKDGIGQWFAGLILGAVGGIALAFLADNFATSTLGQYRFYRGAVILFGCLAVALCLALISKMHASEKEILPYMIWTLSTIFVVPILILTWLKKEVAKESSPKECSVIGTANISVGAPASSGPVAEKSTPEVMEALGARIGNMTVAEISKETGKTERGVRTYLTRHGINAKDYDGASKKAKAMAS